MLRLSGWFRAALFGAAIGLAACGPSLAQAPSADAAARLLAGMPVPAQSPLAGFTADAAWKAHAKYLDGAWKALDQRQLSKIRAWGGLHISQPQQTMFYMFSGPDFLYADAFFPKASTYVLAALEPPGQVPDLTKISPRALGAELRQIQSSLTTILNLSFFITKDMKTKLAGGPLSGTLPVLYVFLARSGKTIREVSFINLDAEGAAHAPDAAVKSAAKGVKITFANAEGREQTLYYFSTDISNYGLKTSGFAKFLEKLGPADSFVKSASYLLHSGNFSDIRDLLLKQSNSIVQDDSGIPLRYFDAAGWQLSPFGAYLGPISIFAQHSQPKMRELFRKGKAAPIDFGMGYRWRPRESNLLLATKTIAKAQSGQ